MLLKLNAGSRVPIMGHLSPLLLIFDLLYTLLGSFHSWCWRKVEIFSPCIPSVRDKSWILARVDLDAGGDSELFNLWQNKKKCRVYNI